jgi:hypothetical protein
MTEPEIEQTIELARRASPAQTAGRDQQWRWMVSSRLDRKRNLPRAAVLLAAGGVAAVAVVGWRYLGTPSVSDGSRRPEPASVPPRPDRAPEPRIEQLADGSRIFIEGPSTVLRKRLETGDDVLYELGAGSALFEVAPRRPRTFRVQAGPVAVTVIGTRFEVQRLDKASRISVTDGHVLVSWPGGSKELRAGEEETFPHDASPPPAASIPKTQTTRPRAAPEGPAALFERADRARRQGNPALAAAHLRTIVERHPDAPHAAAASFTLGRLSLESLSQPRESALWFEKARLLAKGEPLAEDALAREVEAWSAAGDRVQARQRAALYQRTYPNGSRLKSVLRLGGLQPGR